MMADQTTPENENGAKAAEKPAESVKTESEATAPAAGVAGNEALVAEVTEMKNKLLRTLAEMENLRRRTEREVADARQYAVANFARDMLTVGDNLRRALDHVPKDQRGKGDAALDALVEGVEVTERGLEQTLGKFGVKRTEAKGQKFDPTLHQAMFEVESAEQAPGTVAEEVQAGYVIGERVLRPALVGVVKRPKPAGADPEPKVTAAPEGPES
jgi:molecular chaperone GrpE